MGKATRMRQLRSRVLIECDSRQILGKKSTRFCACGQGLKMVAGSVEQGSIQACGHIPLIEEMSAKHGQYGCTGFIDMEVQGDGRKVLFISTFLKANQGIYLLLRSLPRFRFTVARKELGPGRRETGDANSKWLA